MSKEKVKKVKIKKDKTEMDPGLKRILSSYKLIALGIIVLGMMLSILSYFDYL